MGIFTKESRTTFHRDEAGNVVKVTRTGASSSISKAPVYDSLKPQVKKLDEKAILKKKIENKKKWKKRKQKYDNAMKSLDRALDWIEGTPARKPRKKKKGKQKFVVVKGKAYPVGGKSGGKKKKKKSKPQRRDPLDFNINW